MHRAICAVRSITAASLARCSQTGTGASRSARSLHSAAPARFLARSVLRSEPTPSSSSSAPSAGSDAAASSSVSARSASDEDAARALLARNYFPFAPSVPAALPLQGFPLCRAAYGGPPHPGSNAIDASVAVKSYLRLGGNLVHMHRSVSFDLVDAFAEVIEEGRAPAQVVLGASVSAADVMAFVEGEANRFKAMQARRPPRIENGRRVEAPFVSELRQPGEAVPTRASELAPMLPRVFPAFLRHFLALHDLDCLDLLLLEPPPVNSNPDRVPDESFAWMGGVDRSVASEQGFVDFVATWFQELEQAQRAGLIRSYGLSSARITMVPTAKECTPHGAELYVPLSRVLDAAKGASAKAGPMSGAVASEAAQLNGHNLSTLQFPFSLFSAQRLLCATPVDAADDSASSSSPSFFEQVRAHNLLTLGETPFDDVTPLPSAEWFRFAQPALPPTEAADSASANPDRRPSDPEAALPIVPSSDEASLPERYSSAMRVATALEHTYTLLLTESRLSPESVPPRLPDLSWASLIHTHQSDVFSSYAWERFVYRRLRPTLERASARLKALDAHPNLREWAAAYTQAMQPVIHTFGSARTLQQRGLARKLCRALDAAAPKLRTFPTLQEKTLMILLSTPVGAVLTDQMEPWEQLALSLIRAQQQAQANATQDPAASTQPTADAPPLAVTASASASSQDLPAVFSAHVLTAAELQAVFAVVLRVPGLLLPEVVKDPLRKNKPTTIQ